MASDTPETTDRHPFPTDNEKFTMKAEAIAIGVVLVGGFIGSVTLVAFGTIWAIAIPFSFILNEWTDAKS